MISLDITGVLAKTITPSLGVCENELATINNTLKNYVADFLKEREAGKHEWTMMPYDKEMISAVAEYAKKVKKMKIETILWIGKNDVGRKIIILAAETVSGPRTEGRVTGEYFSALHFVDRRFAIGMHVIHRADHCEFVGLPGNMRKQLGNREA